MDPDIMGVDLPSPKKMACTKRASCSNEVLPRPKFSNLKVEAPSRPRLAASFSTMADESTSNEVAPPTCK